MFYSIIHFNAIFQVDCNEIFHFDCNAIFQVECNAIFHVDCNAIFQIHCNARFQIFCNAIFQVDCDAIFASEEIDKPSGHKAMQWEMIPEHIQVCNTNAISAHLWTICVIAFWNFTFGTIFKSCIHFLEMKGFASQIPEKGNERVCSPFIYKKNRPCACIDYIFTFFII